MYLKYLKISNQDRKLEVEIEGPFEESKENNDINGIESKNLKNLNSYVNENFFEKQAKYPVYLILDPFNHTYTPAKNIQDFKFNEASS